MVLTSDTPVLANTEECETGSTVNGMYLKVEVASNEAFDSGAIPNVYLMVMKNPGGNITFPNPNVVGSSDTKKYVIHQEMIMIQNSIGGNPRILFNGVIKFPKHLRRNGPSDRWILSFFSPAINIALCFQCHYKEFR